MLDFLDVGQSNRVTVMTINCCIPLDFFLVLSFLFFIFWSSQISVSSLLLFLLSHTDQTSLSHLFCTLYAWFLIPFWGRHKYCVSFSCSRKLVSILFNVTEVFNMIQQEDHYYGMRNFGFQCLICHICGPMNLSQLLKLSEAHAINYL